MFRTEIFYEILNLCHIAKKYSKLSLLLCINTDQTHNKTVTGVTPALQDILLIIIFKITRECYCFFIMIY